MVYSISILFILFGSTLNACIAIIVIHLANLTLIILTIVLGLNANSILFYLYERMFRVQFLLEERSF